MSNLAMAWQASYTSSAAWRLLAAIGLLCLPQLPSAFHFFAYDLPAHRSVTSIASGRAPSSLRSPLLAAHPLRKRKLSMVVDVQQPVTTEEIAAKRQKLAIAGSPMVIGLSHHTATVDVRERLSIPESEWDAASARIRTLNSVNEAGVLSTCNRFEVYISTADQEGATDQVLSFLEEHSGLDRPTLLDNLFFDHDDDAVSHVLRVSAGFDSLVVGEGQILSQVKACYNHGISSEGSFGKVLTKLFNTAVASGKRVRSETKICQGAVSISSAAVELAIMRSEEKLNKPLSQAKVCIVGAGKMSRLAVTHLLSQDVMDIHIVNRGMERMQELADGFPDASLNLYLLDELWPQMMDSDLIITSTGSTGCLVTKENLGEHWGERNKPMMLVDISVPRNVEQETNELDRVVAYNVDDLKAVVEMNQAKRKDEMLEAEKLLDEEHEQFTAWKESLRCIPAITAIQKRGEAIRQEEMGKYMSKMSQLGKKERQMVEKMTKGIVNKLLHGPMSEMRTQDHKGIDVSTKLAVVDAMFNLGLLDDEEE